ncbi:MAG TPA: phosphotransferase [Terriglobales bacterium]|nr:phosphotransferase [Terriglobales bacterium]
MRRLRVLAREALREFGIAAARLRPLRYAYNATFRVDFAGAAGSALLRIHAAERSPAALHVELDWLRRLTAAGLAVPRPLATPFGGLFARSIAPGVPGPRCCTLLSWQPGQRLGRRPAPATLFAMGALVADLHANTSPRRGIQPRPYWTAHSFFHDRTLRAGWRRLSPARRALWRRVGRRFAAAQRALGCGREVFGLIHGDLTFDNFLRHGGALRVIDFDDCGFGHFLFDLATLLDRIEWRKNYPELRAAFLAGYRSRRPLSPAHELDLPAFLLARWCFLGLAFLAAPAGSPGRAYAPVFLRIVTPKIKRELDTRG